MKAILNYVLLFNLLLFAMPQVSAARFVRVSESGTSYNSLFIIFLILDVLFGFFLILGKFIKIRKEDPNYSYMESRQTIEEIS